MRKALNILQVNSYDRGGGAEKVAYDLFRAYRGLGHDSHLAVGLSKIDEEGIWTIPNDAYRNPWSRFWRKHQIMFSGKKRKRIARLSGWLANVGELRRWLEWRNGIEDFNFPATKYMLDLASPLPDVIHIHNLHGGYFDLRALPELSRRLPVILTLHDEWAFTGHCSYAFDCHRWETGCGECPSLQTYPAVQRDATAYNLQRKREIYLRSNLYLSAPSQWLLDKAIRSVINEGIADVRLVPNGVDLSVFSPKDKLAARRKLNLELDTKIALFVGNKTRSNQFKDYATIESAVKQVAIDANGEQVIFLCIGEKAAEERIGSVVFRFIEYQDDPRKIAMFYQAADVFLHAARADNFPITVLESLACGTPVVATAVGGITEQVDDGRTGFLVPKGESSAMAKRVQEIFSDENMRRRMSENAAGAARQRFDLQQQVKTYLEWYQEILERSADGADKQPVTAHSL